MTDYTLLKERAVNFGAIARQVNESSKIRKSHSEEAVKYITMLKDIGVILEGEISRVAETNRKHRDFDISTLNACNILTFNLESQKILLVELFKEGVLSSETHDSIMKIISALESAINEASANLKEIIDNDNRIIFKDIYLISRKSTQLKSLANLSNLAEMILTDAENAIKGSAANLQRGLQMVEKIQNVPELVKTKNIDQLKTLLNEAVSGRNTAVTVNTNSASQLSFSEKVNSFTRQLLEDSMEIKEIVAEKHSIFESNLQIITVLTVIISLNFEQYLSIEKLLNQINNTESSASRVASLIQLIKMAVEEVKKLTSQNYDITDSIQRNNEVETKTVSMTASEVDYYNRITEAVSQMTEATRYPIEGSAKNIENAGILEQELKKIIESI